LVIQKSHIRIKDAPVQIFWSLGTKRLGSRINAA
jgi:hypothetical protein